MAKHFIILSLLNEPFLFAGCIPSRYILAVLGSISLAILYGLRVNLSVAIVVMVNHTYQHSKSSTFEDSLYYQNETESVNSEVS